MITRSKSEMVKGMGISGERRSVRGDESVKSSSSRASRESVIVQEKAAELEYQKKLADLNLEEIAVKKAIARAEYESEIAIVRAEGSSRHSQGRSAGSRSSVATNVWVDQQQVLYQQSKQVSDIFNIEKQDTLLNPHGLGFSSNSRATQCVPGFNLTSPEQVQNSGITELATAINSLVKNTVPTGSKSNVDLPQFSGNVLEWFLFKKTFDDTNANYSCSENLARLRIALRGEARVAVLPLLMTSMEPKQVMRALELRFARHDQVVCHQISTIRALPKLGKNTADIHLFATTVKNCVSVIKMLDQIQYIYSPEILHGLILKLSPLLQNKWCDYAAFHNAKGQPLLELLADFLEEESSKQTRFGGNELFYTPTNVVISKTESPVVRQRTPVVQVHAQNQYNKSFTSKPSTSFHVDTSPPTVSTSNSLSCTYCSADHSIKSCKDFIALSIVERTAWVRKAKLCPRCLKKGFHNWKRCPKVCNICKLHHNTLIHVDSTLTTSQNVNNVTCPILADDNIFSKVSPDTEESVLNSTVNSFSKQVTKHKKVLLKILPVVLRGPNGDVNTFALLDDGSTTTLIDADLSESLGLTGTDVKVSLDCINGRKDGVISKLVEFQICGRYCAEFFKIRGARTLHNLRLTSQSVHLDDLDQCNYLRDISKEIIYEDAQPKVLIGLSDWHLMVSKENRVGYRSQPAAIRTALGWVLYGPISRKTLPVQFVNYITSSDNCEKSLDELIKDNYKLESIGIRARDPFNKDELRALKILEETTRRLDNGRFEVGLLWREDDPKIPDSYQQAVTRLNSLDRRFKKDNSYHELYKLNIEAYVSKDYAEECSSTHNDSIDLRRWYLPHFGVTHPHKPGKLRIVHDAASKSRGVSLNSFLLPGPDFIESLLGILYRFRRGQVALTADIREMFPQIKIRPADQDCQRYLWKPFGPGGEIREFKMTSLIFGSVSSPCSAIYIKNRNAQEFETTFPKAAKAIVKDHYMDDYLGSLDDIEEAAQLASDIVEVHSKCGFVMRGWVTNQSEALKFLSKDLIKEEITDVNMDLGDAGVRVLGMSWNPCKDVFIFKLAFKCQDINTLTKRQALRDLMRIFDPLGLLTPIITSGKILFQRTWRTIPDWDSVLPQRERDQWEAWYGSLEDIQTLNIPRCYFIKPGYIRLELHIFSDASELAYASVAYWRTIYPDGSVTLALIGGKSRVSPLKPVSIPRLELQAALLGSRLARTVLEEHQCSVTRRYFWCDSRTVLAWIRSDARNFKTFVANRVGEISEWTQSQEWYWVPSEYNVADDATRLFFKLGSLQRWLNGPDFLLLSETHWPVESQDTIPECGSEVECKYIDIYVNSISDVLPNSTRFSSWQRLLRVTARCYQFLRLLKNSSQDSDLVCQRRGLRPLLAQDIQNAESCLLKLSQEESFGIELQSLHGKKPFPKESRLRNLDVKIGSDGLMRLRGRIDAVQDVHDYVKEPIILDGHHQVVKLLIRDFRIWANHTSNETIVNEVKQRYWVLRLRPTVRFVAKDCQFCKVKKATAVVPHLGDLPALRLDHHVRPFTNVGLDYFGPIEVTVKRSKEKRYVALFTCLVVRAVHLEVVGSLTSDAAIMALRRFMARRGCPSVLLSDNGTSFVGADRELRKAWQEMDHAQIQEYAASKRITWKFIPPASPFMGGTWERLVKSVKCAILATLKTRSPREEVLSTLLTEAEHIVNSRPLTHVSVAEHTEEALTPNHFLIGISSGLQTTPPLDDRDLLRRSDWRKACRLADHFWSRWIREYLPCLAPRRCASIETSLPANNISVGDVVYIADSNLPRGLWPRGRITHVYPGKDGVVRVADVATAGGILKRPTRKLVKII